MSDEKLPFEYAPQPTDTDALAQVQQLSRDLLTLTVMRDKKLAELQAIDERIKDISERVMPDLLDSLQMEAFRMRDSRLSVEMVERVHVSLPKDPARRERALDVVRRSGNEGAIRTTFEISFGRDSSERVEKLRKLLEESGVTDHAQVSLEETVHPSTYGKIVRELLATDKDIEPGDLGAFRQRVAEIKLK